MLSQDVGIVGSIRKFFSSYWVKLGICAAVAIPVMSALITQIQGMDSSQIAAALGAISAQSIVIAMGLTIVSFIAMSRYDDVALRVLGINVPPKTTLYGGFVATSLGQALGFGLLVGSVARWRCYRAHGVSLAQAGIISSVVIGGFLFGFLVILAVASAIDPSGLATLMTRPETQIQVGAFAVIGVSAVILVASIAGVKLRFSRFAISAPRWRVLRANVVLAALDTIPAAIALWVLIPTEVAPSLLVVIPVYLTALGLGLVSNAPGGIGVLELTCLMALPVTPPEYLLAALIMFRGIFYGIPMVLGLCMLIAKEFPTGVRQQKQPEVNRVLPRVPVGQLPDAVAPILRNSQRAESELARGGDKEFLISNCGRSCLMFAQSGNSLVVVSDPIGPSSVWGELINAFTKEAAKRYVAPVFYKASPVFVALLKREGMQSCRISAEAEIPLSNYSLEGSYRRELRRKFRRTEKAGVTLTVCSPGQFNAAQFSNIAAEWQADRNEKGFSMGRFDAEYLASHDVIEAKVDNCPVGFVSVWTSGDGTESSIDLMRLSTAAPDGTMHALCHKAALLAQSRGARVLSLCSVPFAGIDTPENTPELLIDWLFEKKTKWHGAKGLFRFKNAFRPQWAPRFLAAPNWFDATLGSWDIARLISAPPPNDTPQHVTIWDHRTNGEFVAAAA